MDYSIFRFKAVVDFIEVEIHTAQKHLGGVMHNRCAIFGFSHITPIDANAGGWANTFTTRLYDLRTFAALQSKLATIGQEFPLTAPPTISMIEVAFDGYLKDPTAPTNRDHLAALAARMVYRLAAPVSENRRIYRDGKGSPTAIPRSLNAVERKMAEGLNAAVGNRTDDQYQHGYVKTTDHNGKPIPVENHRARFEIRLAGAGLPDIDVESYKDFRFETLAEYINFRKEDEAATLMQHALIAGYADRASHRKNIKRHEGGGVRKNIMPADQELNRIVRKRLQTLTKSWQRPAPGAQKGPNK
jgi:hypothetical protein